MRQPAEMSMALNHERWCRYCRIAWDVQCDSETDAVLNNSDTHCPECDSDDAMKLADAQQMWEKINARQSN